MWLSKLFFLFQRTLLVKKHLQPCLKTSRMKRDVSKGADFSLARMENGQLFVEIASLMIQCSKSSWFGYINVKKIVVLFAFK